MTVETVDDLAPDSSDFRRFVREQRRIKEQVLDQARRVQSAVKALSDTGQFKVIAPR